MTLGKGRREGLLWAQDIAKISQFDWDCFEAKNSRDPTSGQPLQKALAGQGPSVGLRWLRDSEHPIDRGFGSKADILGNIDFILEVLQTAQGVFHGDLRHMRAAEATQP